MPCFIWVLTVFVGLVMASTPAVATELPHITAALQRKIIAKASEWILPNQNGGQSQLQSLGVSRQPTRVRQLSLVLRYEKRDGTPQFFEAIYSQGSDSVIAIPLPARRGQGVPRSWLELTVESYQRLTKQLQIDFMQAGIIGGASLATSVLSAKTSAHSAPSYTLGVEFYEPDSSEKARLEVVVTPSQTGFAKYRILSKTAGASPNEISTARLAQSKLEAMQGDTVEQLQLYRSRLLKILAHFAYRTPLTEPEYDLVGRVYKFLFSITHVLYMFGDVDARHAFERRLWVVRGQIFLDRIETMVGKPFGLNAADIRAESLFTNIQDDAGNDLSGIDSARLIQALRNRDLSKVVVAHLGRGELRLEAKKSRLWVTTSGLTTNLHARLALEDMLGPGRELSYDLTVEAKDLDTQKNSKPFPFHLQTERPFPRLPYSLYYIAHRYSIPYTELSVEDMVPYLDKFRKGALSIERSIYQEVPDLLQCVRHFY